MSKKESNPQPPPPPPPPPKRVIKEGVRIIDQAVGGEIMKVTEIANVTKNVRTFLVDFPQDHPNVNLNAMLHEAVHTEGIPKVNDKHPTKKGFKVHTINGNMVDGMVVVKVKYEANKPVDYQDVLVKECQYCPCNYIDSQGRYCVIDQKWIDGPRDKKNFPEFCPLADKPVLIRRK